MAAITNFYIDAGATFGAIITVKGSDGVPLNLSDYTVASQIRKSYASLTAYNFNATVYSTGGGKIRLSLTPTQSAAIKPGRYLYDVEITANGTGEKLRVSEGLVIITPQITQI